LHSTKTILLDGEIVEIIEEGGNQKAKILTNPQYIEVILETHNDIHLGEKVTIESEVTIKKITPVLV